MTDKDDKLKTKLRASEAARVALVREVEKRLKKERGKVLDELEQAHTCLEEYGDVDYSEMTQGGNQGLRHVDQALDILRVAE